MRAGAPAVRMEPVLQVRWPLTARCFVCRRRGLQEPSGSYLQALCPRDDMVPPHSHALSPASQALVRLLPLRVTWLRPPSIHTELRLALLILPRNTRDRIFSLKQDVSPATQTHAWGFYSCVRLCFSSGSLSGSAPGLSRSASPAGSRSSLETSLKVSVCQARGCLCAKCTAPVRSLPGPCGYRLPVQPRAEDSGLLRRGWLRLFYPVAQLCAAGLWH